MNQTMSQHAGPKGTKMESARHAQRPVQQNYHALHLSLRGRFSRRSRESLQREEFAARNAFRAAEFADTSAARTIMISRRIWGALFLSWACAGFLQAQEASPIPAPTPVPESDPTLAHRPAAT